MKRAGDGHVIVVSERSGKRSQWLFDIRAVMLEPQWLSAYAEEFWDRFKDKYPFQVCGMETAGIPLVAAVVMKSVERGTPVNGFYIRKSRKRQDLMQQIEGTVTDDPIIVVDDLINTGNTKHKQLKILGEAEKKVSDIFVVLRYRENAAYDFLKEYDVSLSSLYSLSDFGIAMLKENSPEIPKESFEVVWHFKGPDPSFHLVVQKSAPVLDEKRLFFGADDGTFYALDQKNGSVVWSFKVGKHPEGKGILSTPAVHDGVVYFGAYDGNVYALDAASGKVKWINNDADWIGSSPALAPDLNLLYIGLEFGLWNKRGGIATIDMHTGKKVWTIRHPSLTHGSPTYIKEEGMVVIGSNNGVAYAYDAKTGRERWRYATAGDIKVCPAYDPKRRLVFVVSMDGKLYALRAQDGIPVYAKESDGGIYSIPLVHDDTVYFASLDKTIYAIDLDMWKEKWAYETTGRIFGAPIIANRSLWCGSNDGKLYELDPESGALKSFFQASERVMSKICFNESNKLFLRTVENEIYCLKKTGGHTGAPHPEIKI